MTSRRRRKRGRGQPSGFGGEGTAETEPSGPAEPEQEASGPPPGDAHEPSPPPDQGPAVPEQAPRAERAAAAEQVEPEATGKGGLISEARAALAPVKKRHIMIASVGVIGFLFAGTLLFAAVSFWWTSQPSFCGRCHVMEPYISAWERSAHKEVNCESCHLTPGFFGFVGGKIAGLQVVANYIRGDYEDWSFNAAVSNASCLQCHEEILTQNIHNTDTGVLVSHQDIVETGGKCMFCHSTVAHGEATQVGSSTHPTMSTCLTCHNDEIAPLDCDLCHVGKKPPPEDMPSPEPGSG